MLKFLRKLVAPAFKLIDSLNARWEPFKEPDPSYAVLPPLDTLQFKLATTSDVCKADLRRFIKSEVFFWDILDNGGSSGGNDLGDNCLWQGVYLAYLANIGDIGQVNKVIVEAMIPLSTYGGSGILLRGVAHKTDFTIPPPPKADRYFMNGDWVCYSDASMGSMLGFCYGLTYALCSPKTRGTIDRDLVRMLAARVAESVVSNDYRIMKHDGTATDWGNLKPGIAQAPCRLLGLLSLLKLAGKDDLYSKIFKESEPFLEYGETHFSTPTSTNHPWYQDHLAFLTYDMLLMLDADPHRRAVYLRGLERLWAKDKKMWNVYFAAIAAKYLPIADIDYAFAMAGLFDYVYPATKTTPKVNSTRPGIATVMYDGKLQAARPLRINDRPPTNYLWQRNPYQLDGSPVWGYSGLDFLFPYSIFSTWVERFKKS